MTIQEIKKEKQQLATEIKSLIHEFNNKTGTVVESVRIKNIVDEGVKQVSMINVELSVYVHSLAEKIGDWD